MPNSDKLIKQGIKYTDKLFAEINKRLEQGVLSSDTLEAFLEKTKEYTTANPLVSSGYDETMLKLILSETNNHKFSRPSQRELVRVTIENRVGDLIQDVGEDIKQNVRDIAKAEYTKGSNPQKIAKQITAKVDGIKNKRARTIARTEVARASTVSDYVINKERGATGFTVSCRSTRCAKCKEAFCKDSATGGDVEYSMDDVSVLPPLHPNCRCSVEFTFDRDKFKGKVSTQKPTTTTTTTDDDIEFNNNLLAGKPEVYKDVDEYGKELTVYKYGDIELAFNEKANITHEELRAHIASLPKLFESANVSRIYIHDYSNGNIGGVFQPLTNEIHVYHDSKQTMLNNFNHEFAHGVDYLEKYSNTDKYEKIFKRDNRTNEYRKINVVDFELVTNKFASEYAGRHYLKCSRDSEDSMWYSRRLGEDFAESVKHYLNPNDHKWFVKEYPNRGEYLQELFGKPDFKNSGLKHTSQMDQNELKEREIQKYGYTGRINVEQQVSKKLTETKNKIKEAEFNIANAKNDIDKGTWEFVRDEYKQDIKPLENLLNEIKQK